MMFLGAWHNRNKQENSGMSIMMSTSNEQDLCKSRYILGLCPLDATHHRYPIQTSGPLLRKVSPHPPGPLPLSHTEVCMGFSMGICR